MLELAYCSIITTATRWHLSFKRNYSSFSVTDITTYYAVFLGRTGLLFSTQLTCNMWATSPAATLLAKSVMRRDAVHDIPLPQFPWILHLIRHEVMHVPSGL